MSNLSNWYGGNNNSVSYVGWTDENNVATDQTPSVTASGQLFRFTSSTSADRTLTLPTVGSADNGTLFWVQNKSAHVITITPNDQTSVWTSGNGYGIELVEKSLVCLRYNHAETNWDIINKSGGLVRLEKLKLYLPCDFMGTYQVGGSWGLLPDYAKRHAVWPNNSTILGQESYSKFGVGCLEFDGTSRYAYSDVSPDWDVFGSTSGDCTVAGWVYFTNASGFETMFCHWQNTTNLWQIYRNSTGLNIYLGNGSVQINMSGGTLSNNAWYHVALVRSGSVAGGYINGSQVSYDGSFVTTNLTGSLYMGQQGNSSSYLHGRLDDIVIAAQNIYNANPNSGNTDTLSNWNQKFDGVQ